MKGKGIRRGQALVIPQGGEFAMPWAKEAKYAFEAGADVRNQVSLELMS